MLSAFAASNGYRLHHFDHVTSTNDAILDAARDKDRGMLWITADHQSAGRGRYGRKWQSLNGNFFASLLLIDPCETALAAQLGFVAGLAVHDAVSTRCNLKMPKLSIKWPNDVLIEGRKTAGLLLEGHRLPDPDRFAVIIGIGINLAHEPENVPYPATSLKKYAVDLSPQDMMQAVSESFAHRYVQWHAHEGFYHVRKEWLERAAGLMQPISVRLQKIQKQGVFTGLDAFGRLMLQTTNGLETIDAGDIYFDF